jgi:hypothetical protein
MSELMPTKSFHLGDLLSASTGALVSPRHMEGIYDLFGWILQDNSISTIGLVMVADTMEAEVKRQFPVLADVTAPDFEQLFAVSDAVSDQEKEAVISQWVHHVAANFFDGKDTFLVTPLGGGAPNLADQLNYVAAIRGSRDGVLVVEVPFSE